MSLTKPEVKKNEVRLRKNDKCIEKSYPIGRRLTHISHLVSHISYLIPFIFFSTSLFAQQYGFINYSIENGLAQSQVNAICQDNKGYLWLGTNGGVSRFDGKNFVNFYKENGLIDNWIESICLDAKGNLWFGTLGGISKYDGNKFHSYTFNPEHEGNYVETIIEDAQGNIWMGTDGGVISFDESTFTYYSTKDGLPDNLVRSICLDGENKLWIGTKGGLCFFEKGRFVEVKIADSTLNISSIARQHDVLWISTLGNGVFNYKNAHEIAHYDQSDGLIDPWIRSVTVDSKYNVWFSSISGLCKYDGEVFKNFRSEQGLIHHNVKVAYEDSQGNLWLGTDGKGIFRFCGEDFVTYTTENGLNTDIVMSIVEDKSNEIWAGTYGGGVAKKQNDSFTSYQIPGGVNHNTVYSSIVDNENTIWFGTGNGLFRYKDKQFIPFTANGDFKSSTYSLMKDAKDLWIGGETAVYKYSENSLIRYGTEKNFKGEVVTSIIKDHKGVFWFASQKGLISFDGKQFKTYTTQDGLSDIAVANIIEDKQGNLWLGTSSGLNFYDRKEFRSIKFSDNFSSNQILFLTIDDFDNLWAGTNNGIYSFHIPAYIRDGELNVNHFSIQQGLKSIECNLNAVLKDSKGDLWFGTAGGLVKYNPSKTDLPLKPKQPYLNLTGIRLSFQKVDWKPFADSIENFSGLPLGLKIDYKKNHLTFDYLGINLSNPDNVRYRFMLEGFDEDWSPVTKETFATYSYLTDGFYTFKIVVTDLQGKWLSEPLSFSFTITPPFWKTWWFVSLCIIVVLFSAWLIYRWRWAVIKRKRQTQQLVYKSKLLALEQQTLNASMNRHFIFNALNSIQYYINRQDKLSANKYLTSFAKLIRKNLDSSENNLVSLSEELERLELYLSLEHMRFANKFEYEIKIQDDIDTESVKIPPMILQPYVENSIWHGILPMEKPGKITIEIKKDEESIYFIIQDNGIGIQASMQKKAAFPTEHDSKGMKITETRINLLRKMTNLNIQVTGPYDIKDNNHSQGAKVEIVLPLKKYLENA